MSSSIFAECNEQLSGEDLLNLSQKDINDFVDSPNKTVNTDELITNLIVNNKKQDIENSPVFIKSNIEKIVLNSLDLPQIKQKIYLNSIDLAEAKIRKLLVDTKKDTYSLIQIAMNTLDECSGKIYTVKEKRLIFPKKIIEFQSLSGEKRYLLPIELWKVNEFDSEQTIEKPYIELFLFKKKHNLYQLVSRNPPSYKGFDIDTFDNIANVLEKNITKFGKNTMGSYFEKVSSFMGYVIPDIANWDIVLFTDRR